AGINAGTAALRRPAPWICVLAVDQPRAAPALEAITGALPTMGPEVQGVCHLDAEGHPQWLLAAYRTEALLMVLAGCGTGHGVAMRRLVAPLQFHYLREGAEHIGDIDTWDDHARWEQRLHAESGDTGRRRTPTPFTTPDTSRQTPEPATTA